MKDPYTEITEIYRKTGEILRKYGASRLYIIHSKTEPYYNAVRIQMEIVVDHLNDYNNAKEELQKTFSNVAYKLYDGACEENYKLLREAEEEGIQL